ncbi:MAG: peptidoglycan editing factor PgeF [Cyanobacteria bacterium]|nr:peptidoglycan editing factor PgeF [Cyanobacteriota bacterium]MDA1246522.1 peptidoglycan editing factor PgeF [Cyanobacteriota bacterium]
MAEAVDPPFDRPDRDFNSLPGWTWIGTYGGYYLQCDLLQSFEHGFFTRQWQGRKPEVLAAYVSAGVSVHRLRQVHSPVVLPASQASADPFPEADGLISDAGGQSLWVCGADCTPVLIADPASGRVVACHAGWRGVAGGILERAVQLLVEGGSRPTELLVALGPAIGGGSNQVQRKVSEQVAASLDPSHQDSSMPALLEQLRQCGALQADPDPMRDRLDIRLAARFQLELLGVPTARIGSCPLCTVSEPLLFHSWRRDQVKAVQWSGIVSQA